MLVLAVINLFFKFTFYPKTFYLSPSQAPDPHTQSRYKPAIDLLRRRVFP